jgi:hypothetical protein
MFKQHIYCFLDNLTLFDLLIKFWPPSLDFNSENNISTSQPQSSGEYSGELNIYSLDIIVIEEIFYSIKSSSTNSSDFDSDLFIESISAFLYGLDQGFGGWSTANTIASLSLVLPPSPEKEFINWIIQILSIVIFIGVLVLHISISRYNKYEWGWFLLGAGIVSIANGILFHKAGKSKDHHNWTGTLRDNYSEALKKLNRPSEYVTDWLCKDFFPQIIDTYVFIVYDKNGLEPPDYYKILLDIAHLISFGLSLHDWLESFDIVRLVSNMAMHQGYNYDKRLKNYCGISTTIGAVLIVLGIKMLFLGPEEN